MYGHERRIGFDTSEDDDKLDMFEHHLYNCPLMFRGPWFLVDLTYLDFFKGNAQ